MSESESESEDSDVGMCTGFVRAGRVVGGAVVVGVGANADKRTGGSVAVEDVKVLLDLIAVEVELLVLGVSDASCEADPAGLSEDKNVRFAA